jgi:hypothetical protein
MANKSTILHDKLTQRPKQLCRPGWGVRPANNADGYEMYPHTREARMEEAQRLAARMTRDAGSIGEHVKKRVALDPAKMQKVIAAMRDVDQRLGTLEAQRRAPRPMPQPQPKPAPPSPSQPTHDQQPLAEGTLFKNPDGSVVFVPADDAQRGFYGLPGAPGSQPETMNFVPFSSQQTKDSPMPRNPNLAPLQNITFDKPKVAARDRSFAQRRRDSLGKTPSRFDSREQDRLSRSAPGAAGPPSAAELNATYGRAHSSGASGQMRAADDGQEKTACAPQARTGVAPLNTPVFYRRGPRK